MACDRCSRLGLVALAYLWRRDQAELLQEMVDCSINAIIIKVAALGLHPNKHLGQRISEIQPHLLKMVTHFQAPLPLLQVHTDLRSRAEARFCYKS